MYLHNTSWPWSTVVLLVWFTTLKCAFRWRVEECSLWLSPIISAPHCAPTDTGVLLQESWPLRHSVETPSLNNDRHRPQRTGVETGLNWIGLALVGLEAVGYRCANSCPPRPWLSPAPGWWMVGAQSPCPLAYLPIGPTACPLDRPEQMSSVNSVKNYKTPGQWRKG